jgi:hypothetical protein
VNNGSQSCYSQVCAWLWVVGVYGLEGIRPEAGKLRAIVATKIRDDEGQADEQMKNVIQKIFGNKISKIP